MGGFARHVVEALARRGVDLVFGIPGVHTVELYRALDGSGIRHVTPRHEQGAGFMAEGYARVSGRPGVCFVITGPGLTNIATAVAQAYGESLPMLVISAVNARGAMGTGGGHLHELPDQRSLMGGITAFSHTVLDPEEFNAALDRAFALFGAARPRPVHIELPLDLLSDAPAPASPDTPARVFPPGPDPQAIEEAARACRRSRSPVILAGGGSVRAHAEIKELAERLDAPVVMTTNGRGVLAAGHPLGVPLGPATDAALALWSQADLLIALGTEMGPTDFEDRPARLKGGARTFVRVDIDPQQLCRGMAAGIGVASDTRVAVRALNAALAREPMEVKREAAGPLLAKAALQAFEQGLSPRHKAMLETVELVRDALPDAVIVGDSTQPVYSACMGFAPLRPSSFFCSATGYGTLGYALPAAVGAKLAAPERPVVCIIGDGGLQFTLPELGAAVEAAAPLIVILWNNNGYGEIKSFMEAQGIAPLGVDIGQPDFQGIAAAYRWDWRAPASRGELARQLAEAERAARPVIIEIDEAACLRWQAADRCGPQSRSSFSPVQPPLPAPADKEARPP